LRSISLIGATGSIGRQTLTVVAAHPDKLKVVALAAGARHLEEFARQIIQFDPEVVSVPDAVSAQELRNLLGTKGKHVSILWDENALETIATHALADILVTGVVGFLGLKPTVAAIKKGKTIALANKETLVAAGGLVIPMLKQFGAQLLPVDSEHSAIFQSLHGYKIEELNKKLDNIWLTASGGPFLNWTDEQIENATISDALNHPNWSMGKKITVDSATLMNKGLEIIEARWLFNIPAEKIKVVIHPQSILHSAVEFVDGSIIGQFGMPDMRLPIHYALFYPERVASVSVPRLSLSDIGQLTFREPDLKKFPCLALAQTVANEDNTLPSVLNAANEVIVEAFLQERLKFGKIAESIERILHKHRTVSKPSLEDILEADQWARRQAENLVSALA
jgi:1-deoxy-D-xylulose-5-phosphate reductoisomerase